MAESRFQKLARKIAHEYIDAGYSKTAAREIGRKTAAKVGFRKYGKRRMERKPRRGRRPK